MIGEVGEYHEQSVNVKKEREEPLEEGSLNGRDKVEGTSMAQNVPTFDRPKNEPTED